MTSQLRHPTRPFQEHKENPRLCDNITKFLEQIVCNLKKKTILFGVMYKNILILFFDGARCFKKGNKYGELHPFY